MSLEGRTTKPHLLESRRGHYLGVFTSNKKSPKWQAWDAMSEAEQAAKGALGVAAIQKWEHDHADAIVHLGGPLGPTKRVSEAGIAEVVNALTVYVVVRAASHAEAADMFLGHPHMTIFTCDAVDVMPVLG